MLATISGKSHNKTIGMHKFQHELADYQPIDISLLLHPVHAALATLI